MIVTHVDILIPVHHTLADTHYVPKYETYKTFKHSAIPEIWLVLTKIISVKVVAEGKERDAERGSVHDEE